MPINGDQSQSTYEVVVNHEGQYSIWPEDKTVPQGWSKAGKQGPKEACLEFISELWTDMRPLSLRAHVQPG